MDTRSKVLEWPEAAKLLASLKQDGARGMVVSGYFDPLLAAGLRRLQALAAQARPLIVILAEPECPILSARARAEIVAALEVVDHVILPPAGGMDALLARVPPAMLARDEETGARERDALIRRVHGLHHSA